MVGWHAGPRPGPDPRNDVFVNVTTDPDAVARLAARYVIADSAGAGPGGDLHRLAVRDRRPKARVMASEQRTCRRCSVLHVIDTPIASAEQRMPALVTSLFERFGARLRYLLAINGAYIAGARAALPGAGRRGDDPPFGVAAGDGNAAEFARIRTEDYQKGVDRRAAGPAGLAAHRRAQPISRRAAASGYVAPQRLISRADVPDGGVFGPPGGYRGNYSRIWGR